MFKNILETINLILKIVVVVFVALVAYWVGDHKAEFEITMIDKENRSKLTVLGRQLKTYMDIQKEATLREKNRPRREAIRNLLGHFGWKDRFEAAARVHCGNYAKYQEWYEIKDWGFARIGASAEEINVHQDFRDQTKVMEAASWKLYCECQDGTQCPEVIEKLKATNEKLRTAHRSYSRILETLY